MLSLSPRYPCKHRTYTISKAGDSVIDSGGDLYPSHFSSIVPLEGLTAFQCTYMYDYLNELEPRFLKSRGNIRMPLLG